MRRKSKTTKGFSLVEMLIAMAAGLVVLGAALQLFSKGMDATWLVSQRAEMQQDGRAAMDLMARDISMAGAGLQTGAALASGTATKPKYGCDQATCYINSGAGITYPTQVVNGNTISYVYGILPGYQKGKVINAGQGNTDVITVAYSDTTFLLDCYQATVTNSTTITFVDPQKLTPPVAYTPPCSTTTNPQVLPQSVTDPAVGLKLGDLVYFTGTTTTGASASAILEVTSTSGTTSPYTVTFGDPDALKLNQTGATSGNLNSIKSATGTVDRIWVITYYLDVPAGTGLPTLMRQVNGQTPTPVAENVSDLEFSYEIYDDTKTPPQATTRDANLALGGSPSLIKKVNILHMTMRSALPGVQGYQGLDVHTSVSARNLGIKDQFPLQ
jgi:prepilin-type N-terminal cleavage/methylation domain-containing protein